MASTKKLAGALLVAAAVGATVGILAAPGKGKDTRKKLSAKAGDLSDSLKKKFDNLVEDLKCEYEELRKKTKEYREA